MRLDASAGMQKDTRVLPFCSSAECETERFCSKIVQSGTILKWTSVQKLIFLLVFTQSDHFVIHLDLSGTRVITNLNSKSRDCIDLNDQCCFSVEFILKISNSRLTVQIVTA